MQNKGDEGREPLKFFCGRFLKMEEHGSKESGHSAKRDLEQT